MYFVTGKPQGLGKYINRTTGVASTAGQFASTFALGAKLFKDIDPKLANVMQIKATQAFAFGEEFPGNTQTACLVSPYFYEEDSYVDDLELAAATLAEFTGKEASLVWDENGEEVAFFDRENPDAGDEPDWAGDADECGFDPYEGCYTYDC